MFIRVICWLQVLGFAASSSSSSSSSSIPSSSSSSKVFSPGFIGGGSTTEQDEILQVGDPRLKIPSTRLGSIEEIKGIHGNPDIKSVRDRLHSALMNHQERYGFGR